MKNSCPLNINNQTINFQNCKKKRKLRIEIVNTLYFEKIFLLFSKSQKSINFHGKNSKVQVLYRKRNANKQFHIIKFYIREN